MSRDYDAICTRCGKQGHRASNCRIPAAEHIAEPYDGQEGMVRCIDCVRRGIYDDYYGRRTPTGCACYVPSMASTLQHCPWFRTMPKHLRAAA
jgi:hypothetical protein